jgi:hypothetical protein
MHMGWEHVIGVIAVSEAWGLYTIITTLSPHYPLFLAGGEE